MVMGIVSGTDVLRPASEPWQNFQDICPYVAFKLKGECVYFYILNMSAKPSLISLAMSQIRFTV